VDASLPAEFWGGKGHYDGAWSKHNPKSNIKFGTCGGIVETQRGPVLLVFPRYDLLDHGQTVHSNCQFEAHGHVVDDKSIAFGGKQCITTHVGYRIPLDIGNGLAYSKPRPFTNDELRDLPQVEMTANIPCRPSKFNSIISMTPSGSQHILVTGAFRCRTSSCSGLWGALFPRMSLLVWYCSHYMNMMIFVYPNNVEVILFIIIGMIYTLRCLISYCLQEYSRHHFF